MKKTKRKKRSLNKEKSLRTKLKTRRSLNSMETLGRDKLTPELRLYTAVINRIFADPDPDAPYSPWVTKHLPLKEPLDLVPLIRTGELLPLILKLGGVDLDISSIVYMDRIPGDGDSKGRYHCLANHTFTLSKLKKFGISVVNVGPGDLFAADENVTLALGITRQILQYVVVNEYSIEGIAETTDKRKLNEKKSKVLKAVNDIIERSGQKISPVRTFSSLRDGIVFSLILHFKWPKKCSLEDLQSDDDQERVAYVLEKIKEIGVWTGDVVKSEDIVKGNPNVNFMVAVSLLQHGKDTGKNLDGKKDEEEVVKMMTIEEEQVEKKPVNTVQEIEMESMEDTTLRSRVIAPVEEEIQYVSINFRTDS